jgi:hypothetical protein
MGPGNMIDNPISTRRALLVWQRPLDQTGRRDRCAVAELVQAEDGVNFQYFDREQLGVAEQAGFSGYPGLPIAAENLSRIASDVLMRRLPPRDRADFSDLLVRFGLPGDRPYTDLSLLAYTGARLTSDSFSVCETFDGFEGAFSYVFDVAGNRHYNYNVLETGEAIFFEHEPANSMDPNAIRLAREGGETVGYINRLQAPTVRSWLFNGSVDATVFRVNGRLQYPRLFVRANIQTNTRAAAA